MHGRGTVFPSLRSSSDFSDEIEAWNDGVITGMPVGGADMVSVFCHELSGLEGA